MRMHYSGRGLPPEIDADCLHLWMMDELSTSDPVRDIYSSQALVNLTRQGTTQINSNGNPVGQRYARVGNLGTGNLYGDLTSGTYLDSSLISVPEFVFGGCIRFLALPAAEGTVFEFISDTATTEQPASLRITSSGTVRMRWSTNQGTIFYTAVGQFVLPVERWIPIWIRKRLENSDSEVYWDLFLYGEFVETLVGDTQPPGIDDAFTPAVYYFGRNHVGTYFPNLDFDHWAIFAAEKSNEWIENQMRRVRRIGFPDVIHSRVKLEDGGGTMRDMTSLAGLDWLQSWDIQDGVDQQTATATVNLLRESGDMTLALLTNNRLNRVPVTAIGPDTQTYSSTTEMIASGRDITIETAPVPAGLSPQTRDWQLTFDGEIDLPEWGGDEPAVRLECRDKTCLLQDTFIEEEITYASDDAEVIMQAILDDNGCGAFTLNVPRSPGWVMPEFTQQRGVSVADALDDIAIQLGWVVRFVYDEWFQSFQLTFYQPDRTYSVTKAMAVLTTDDYRTLEKISLGRANVRNVIRGSYASTENPAPSSWTYAGGGGGRATNGEPTRAWVKVTATDLGNTSIARFGRRFYEPGESVGGNINRKEEAEPWIVAICRDLMDPVADAMLAAWMIPEVAVGTCLKIRAPRPHSDADQRLAVTGWSHHYEGGDASTKLELRGAPTGGTERHLRGQARRGQALPPVIRGNEVLTALPTRARLAAHAAMMRGPAPQRSPRIPIPPNHDFSSHAISRQLPPDGWTISAGTWGTDATVSTSELLTGFQSLQLRTSSAEIKSGLAPVQASQAGGDTAIYQVSVPTKVSGTTTVTIEIEWLDKTEAVLSTSTATTASVTSGAWRTLRGVVSAPSNATFARFVLSRGTGATEVYIDRVMLQPVKPSFRAIRDGTNQSVSDKTTDKVEFNEDGLGRSSGAWDDGGNYDDTTNFIFTAPEDGWYQFSAAVTIEAPTPGNTLRGRLRLLRDGSDRIIDGPQADDILGLGSLTLYVDSGQVWLEAAQTVEVEIFAEEQSGFPVVKKGDDATYFTGRLLANE